MLTNWARAPGHMLATDVSLREELFQGFPIVQVGHKIPARVPEGAFCYFFLVSCS